ncbi:unnamed protein product [Amoebophrya sp. A25]|nr:unnamed protein product [Amoebophrya sp. A25]|eukprot:GSA25T00017750001.1
MYKVMNQQCSSDRKNTKMVTNPLRPRSTNTFASCLHATATLTLLVSIVGVVVVSYLAAVDLVLEGREGDVPVSSTRIRCPVNNLTAVLSWENPDECAWSNNYEEARHKFRQLGKLVQEKVAFAKKSKDEYEIEHLGTIIEAVPDAFNVHEWSRSRRNDSTQQEDAAEVELEISAQEIADDTVDSLLLVINTNGHGDARSASRTEKCDFSSNTEEDGVVKQGRRDEGEEVASSKPDIVLSSGVHGVEGFIGSAVQVRFLWKLLGRELDGEGNEPSSPQNGNTFGPGVAGSGTDNLQHADGADTKKCSNASTTERSRSTSEEVRKILLIHAVNPFGMRKFRRFNERNVDLNRNALTDAEAEAARTRHPNAAKYEDFYYAFNPAGRLLERKRERKAHFSGEKSMFSRKSFSHRLLDFFDDHVYAPLCGGFHQMDTNMRTSTITTEDSNRNNFLSRTQVVIAEVVTIMRTVGLGIFAEMARHGYVALKRALVSAQYHRPSGLWYGGTPGQWEPSVEIVSHILETSLGLEMNPAFVFWIDVHTGLGPYGEYTILRKAEHVERTSSTSHSIQGPHEDAVGSLVEKMNNEAQVENFQNQVEKLLDGEKVEGLPSVSANTSTTGQDVSAGYEFSSGPVAGGALCSIHQSHSADSGTTKNVNVPTKNSTSGRTRSRCLAVTQEFGTFPGVFVALSVILEHWHWLRGTDGSHWTTWAFDPRLWSWRRRTLEGGMKFLGQVLRWDIV